MFRCLSLPRMSFLCGKVLFGQSASHCCSLWEHSRLITMDLMSLNGSLGRVLPSVKKRHSLYRWCTWTEFILNEHKVTALCCQKSGSWVPGKCQMLSHCLSVREHKFHSAFEVRCQVAGPIPADCNAGFGWKPGYWMQVAECPHTMGPTLGTKFVSCMLPLPSLGDGLHSGPTVNAEIKLCNGSLVW